MWTFDGARCQSGATAPTNRGSPGTTGSRRDRQSGATAASDRARCASSIERRPDRLHAPRIVSTPRPRPVPERRHGATEERRRNRG